MQQKIGSICQMNVTILNVPEKNKAITLFFLEHFIGNMLSTKYRNWYYYFCYDIESLKLVKPKLIWRAKAPLKQFNKKNSE